MLLFYRHLSVQILLLGIYRGHFGGKIFRFDTDRRQKVGQRTGIGCTEFALYQCCIKMEQSPIPFRPDNRKTPAIDAALIQDA